MTQPPALNEEERANLVAYLDGELEGPAAQALEAKLSNDPRARAEADSLRRTWQLLDFLPQPQASPNFTHKTLEKLSIQRPTFRKRTPSRWRPWAIAIGWVAGVLAAATVGFVAGKAISPRKPEPPRNQAAVDQALARDMRVIENLHSYQDVSDIHFLEKLADPNDPDVFGDDDFDQ